MKDTEHRTVRTEHRIVKDTDDRSFGDKVGDAYEKTKDAIADGVNDMVDGVKNTFSDDDEYRHTRVDVHRDDDGDVKRTKETVHKADGGTEHVYDRTKKDVHDGDVTRRTYEKVEDHTKKTY